jgi:hypothetical protein
MGMRSSALLTLLLACSTAAHPSMVSGWASGSDGPTCSEVRQIVWAEYKGGSGAHDIVKEVDLHCDGQGIQLSEHHATGQDLVYPLDAASFSAAWRSVLGRVNARECYTREEAIAGRTLPVTTVSLSLVKGSSPIACASESPEWSAVIGELTRIVAEAHARFPGPLLGDSQRIR